MDIESIEKALNSEPMTFTATEIQELLDEELSKDPSEIDMELVERCIDILEEAIKDENTDVEKEGVEKKHISITKILMAAVIAAMFFAIAIPVSAKYINSNISDKIVRFYSNYFSIDLRGGTVDSEVCYSGNDFVSDMKENDFGDIVLPKYLLDCDFYKDYALQIGDDLKSVETSFKTSAYDLSGILSITKYGDNSDYISGKNIVPSRCDQIEQITLSNTVVIIYSYDKDLYVFYIIENTEYYIALSNCNFEIAVDIAKSIG